MWCVDLSERAVRNEDSEYGPSIALIWRADRHVRRLAMMTVEFDYWECRASNSMLSTVDRQAPTILAWRIKVLWTSFPLSREICCSVKAVPDAVALSMRVGITACVNAASLWVLQTQAIGSFDGADIADPINQVSLRC